MSSIESLSPPCYQTGSQFGPNYILRLQKLYYYFCRLQRKWKYIIQYIVSLTLYVGDGIPTPFQVVLYMGCFIHIHVLMYAYEKNIHLT